MKSDDYIERYYICGTYGAVRIFDREHQKCIAGLTFRTEAEAETFLTKLDAPKGFATFMKGERK